MVRYLDHWIFTHLNVSYMVFYFCVFEYLHIYEEHLFEQPQQFGQEVYSLGG